MSTDEYNFNEQYEKGVKGENRLDKFFNTIFNIGQVPRILQQFGCDRIFTNIQSKKRYLIEYKSDERAAKSGNIFVETISVDTENKLGWAYTSCSQYICFYIPGKGEIYIVSTLYIKAKISEWISKYEIKRIKNEGYYTEGVAVPIDEIKKIATAYYEGIL